MPDSLVGVTLVLGGARSGKSAVAERLAARHAAAVTYVATYTPTDASNDVDMAERVAEHRARRPDAWSTLEAGPDLAGVLRTLSGPALVDSLGTWVAAQPDLAVDVDELVEALTGRESATILVSDEVGLGVHPPTELGRRFRDVLGEVNHAVAAVAERVWLVVAGRVLPLESPDALLAVIPPPCPGR